MNKPEDSKKTSKKLRNTLGQHLTEYSLLLILVMAGIMVMGPYVIRSWNAQVRGWELSTKDSFNEPLKTIAPGDFLNLDCSDCTFQPPCGTPPCCGFGGCEETEDSLVHICNVAGCPNLPTQCSSNSSCCSTPVPLPIPSSCGTLSCAPGEVPAQYTCGSDPTVLIECISEPSCINQCQGTIGTSFKYKGICPFDDLGLTNTTTFYNTIFEGTCSNPVGSSPKCQVECKDPYVPVFSNTACDCPSGTYTFFRGSCPAGFYERGSCPAGQTDSTAGGDSCGTNPTCNCPPPPPPAGPPISNPEY